jgi:hypothetical protein
MTTTRKILLSGLMVGCFCWFSASPLPLCGQEDMRFFESKIRPILVKHCYECHSTDSGKARGGLKVDSRDALQRGGDSGPAVVPRSLEDSVLYQALLYHDSGWQMPPKGQLPQSTIDDFRQWILLGAPDPRVANLAPDVASEMDIEAGRQFWAYQPLTQTPPPESTSDWPTTTIDRYVAAQLNDQNLTPVGDAAAEVLVRRLYFVLTGLPPSPADLNNWAAKLDAAAGSSRQSVVAQLVDSLLASDRYGERWGRHWLDVARFAESTGGDHNNIYQHAWRYRNYVIDAFNDDKPFDQFIREQIAGDLLPIGSDQEWANNVIATGFLAIGVKSVGEEDQQRFFADLVDEQIDTTTRAFLATTVACARCHDHKFDPISQREYYEVAALLGGVTQAVDERKGIGLKSSDGKEFDGVAHVIIPKQPPEFHVLIRGNSRDPGEVVSPQGLQAFSAAGLSGDFGLKADAPEAQRRVALAKWITDPRNPLTPRVMVNRLWHYHFGQGIVDSPSDLGYSGGRPSHPELLDWLARRFVDGGWKLKDLHRLIVTSATYRQSSNVTNDAAEKKDSDNRLLWRSNSRRLDGESTRDAMLTISGVLNRTLGGPSFYDMNAKLEHDHSFGDPTGEFNEKVNRRTVYRLWARCGNNPLLESLDCPDPSVMLPRRSQTITPVQSLSLLNNRFVEQCAERLAQRIRHGAGEDVDQQIGDLYRLVLLRNPETRELELARKFVKSQSLLQLCVVILNTNEFLFVE